MPAALLGAVSCGRCAHRQSTGVVCEHCGMSWVPAAAALVSDNEPTPVSGVVRASTGRRLLVHLLDWAPPLTLVILAVVIATGAARAVLPVPVLVSAAVAGVLAQVLALSLRGRTLGRWLLGQRTVDDLTGTPVRLDHLARRLSRAMRPPRFLTADLRRGRDPLEPQLAAPAPPVADPPAASSALALAARTASLPSSPAGVDVRASVGIVLESGERYEIDRALLIGRSPVDPVPGAGRALLAWPDLSRRLAKTHVLLEWSGSELWVTDLNSTTGTAVVTVGGERQPLVPGLRTRATVGSLIVCGGRSIKVVPHG